jgi:hypothetical protein
MRQLDDGQETDQFRRIQNSIFLRAVAIHFVCWLTMMRVIHSQKTPESFPYINKIEETFKISMKRDKDVYFY